MLSQKQLADAAGVPQPYVSQFETDARLADAAIHQRLADVLSVPSSFLTTSPLSLPEGSLGLFRSARSKVPAVSYLAARRKAEMGVEAVARLADGRKLPPVRIETVKGANPKEAAEYARSMLRLPPDTPIGHLTRALERAGVIVLRLANLHDHIGGFSAWTPDPLDRPLIAVRREVTAFRLRFTLAHELGHLVLGHQVFGRPTKEVEDEANSFAGEFLLPEEAMHDALQTGVDLRRLAELKGIWGVSIQALLLRARKLGYLDDARQRSLYEVMRRKGWMTKEPGDDTTEPEKPRLLDDLAQASGMGPDPTELVFHLDFSLMDVGDFFGEAEYDLLSPH